MCVYLPSRNVFVLPPIGTDGRSIFPAIFSCVGGSGYYRGTCTGRRACPGQRERGYRGITKLDLALLEGRAIANPHL